MAAYAFETMSASDAAAFTSADYLFFISNNASATQVSVAPYNTSLGSQESTGTIVTFGGKSLTFSATDLSSASMNQHIQFNDNSNLLIGTNGANVGATLTSTSASTDAPVVIFGLGGSDSISGGDANNYLYGGTDATTSTQATASVATATYNGDTIVAGAGNNHIYGNSLTTQQGASDGNDSITAGGGSNYINGNGGADRIVVGSAASTGSNHVFGGGGNDFITINGAGANAVNGNMGNDSIDASAATFNNSLRGGQGDDTILAGHGQDNLMGDLGADRLVAGSNTAAPTASNYGHLTIMTGGAGNDTFDFSTSASAGNAGITQGANNVHSGIVSGDTTYYQTITDFTQGSDTIHLAFNVAVSDDIVRAQTGVTFTSVSSAEVYAQQLLNNHTSTAGPAAPATPNGEVAAIDVNGNTYLFYNHTGTGSIDSIVQLTGVSSSTLSQAGSGTHTFG